MTIDKDNNQTKVIFDVKKINLKKLDQSISPLKQKKTQ